MSLARTLFAAALATSAVVAGATAARADDGDDAADADDGDGMDDRFFVDKVEADGQEDQTLWQGSLTGTTFAHREAAGISDPLTGATVGAENAAPTRWFTDLRAQLDARHIKGGGWDARVDARARLVSTIDSTGNGGPDELSTQSGTFGGNEYDLRDLYLVRGSTRTDLFLGRQTVLDLAGVKIDGVRLDYAKNRRWTYLGFAGLYPVRGSRSVTTDYPVGVDAMGNPGKRVTPVAGGGGAAYRSTRAYGAIGGVVIVPLSDDVATGTMEQPRLFVTSNGYWRRSSQLDVYHYAVVDIVGAAGFGITNLSAGVNWRPDLRIHVNAAYHRVDTETLDVQAQTQLEDRDPGNVGVIQNNVAVQRIASDSARVSVSTALGKTLRWELSVAGAVRRRPEITLTANPGGIDQTIPAAESAEIFFQAVDRHFYGDLRLAGSLSRVFDLPGLGGNAARSTSTIVRVTANKELEDGRMEVEGDLGFMTGADETRAACSVADIETCYGTSSVRTISLGGTAFYRLKRNWYAMATVELAQQALTVLDGTTEVSQPSILMTTGFLRVAYRF